MTELSAPPMHICYLINSKFPSRAAHTIQVMKMCEAFAQAGCSVTLIVPRTEGEMDYNEIFDYYGVSKVFRILELPSKNRVVANFLMPLVALCLRPHVIYGRHLPSIAILALVGFHSAFEAHYPILRYRPILRRVLAFLSKNRKLSLVVISSALKQVFTEEHKISEHRILIAHDGANLAPVKAQAQSHSSRLQVGYTGHLYSGKGMEIVWTLAANTPWADFHIYGGAPEDIQRWQSHLKASKNVLFHGFIPPSQVEDVQAKLDVCLAPYQRNVSTAGGSDLNIAEWMSPLKIFEYMSQGKAIIASRLPTICEILKDRQTALLCDPDEIEEWSAALYVLKNDLVLRNQLGSTARKHFEQEFTWRHRGSKILSFLTSK